MSPANVGPMKAMVMSLDAGWVAAHLVPLIEKGGTASLRDELRRFAENEGVEI
jgi:signal transduction protein with GAF and PtsI domain